MTKNLVNSAIALYVFLTIISCRDKSAPKDYHVLDFSNVKPLKTDLKDELKYRAISYGQIDTADGSFLKFCYFNGIKDSLFIVMDRDKILVVEMDGHVKKRVEHVGRGPNEYLEIYSSALDKENERLFILGDYSSNKQVSVYSFSGEFLGTIPLSESGSSICYSENSLYYTTLPESESLVRKIELDTNKDIIIQSQYTSRNRIETAIINLDHISIVDDEIIYHKALCDTLFKISEDSLYPYLVLDLGEKSMPVEYHRTLDLLRSKQSSYINVQSTTICDDMLYLCFWYNHILYFDIWDIKAEKLVYRNFYRENELSIMDQSKIGLPIIVNGHNLFFWPKMVADGIVFCELSHDDAKKVISDYNPNLNHAFLMIDMLEDVGTRQNDL